MFKSWERRMVTCPVLVSTNIDAAARRSNRERLFVHGLAVAPIYCASIARQMTLSADEERCARILCLHHNASAIQSVILAFLTEEWFFPLSPPTLKYRLAAKAGLHSPLTRDERLAVAATNPFELDPWV